LVLGRLGRIPKVDPGDAIGGDLELAEVRLDVEYLLEQTPGQRVAPPPDDHVATTAHRSSRGSGPGRSSASARGGCGAAAGLELLHHRFERRPGRPHLLERE